MKDRLLRWLFEELEYERRGEDGSGWGFAYNRATVAVFGCIVVLVWFCVLQIVGRVT